MTAIEKVMIERMNVRYAALLARWPEAARAITECFCDCYDIAAKAIDESEKPRDGAR